MVLRSTGWSRFLMISIPPEWIMGWKIYSVANNFWYAVFLVQDAACTAGRCVRAAIKCKIWSVRDMALQTGFIEPVRKSDRHTVLVC